MPSAVSHVAERSLWPPDQRGVPCVCRRSTSRRAKKTAVFTCVAPVDHRKGVPSAFASAPPLFNKRAAVKQATGGVRALEFPFSGSDFSFLRFDARDSPA